MQLSHIHIWNETLNHGFIALYVLLLFIAVLVCHRLQWTTNLKNLFVSAMNMLIIYLFASMKLEKGHKKNYLALVLKLCYTMIFYEIG